MPTTFQVATLFDSVIDLLQAKIVSTQVVVKKQCGDLLQMTAIFGELRQVVSNLMLNSLDALGEGGRINLRASTSRDSLDGSLRIQITIADNGHGIRAVALSRIFEPFFTTKGSTGNGLGLWVCKQIIEKHYGSLWVRSRTCEPQGTTFSSVCRRQPIELDFGLPRAQAKRGLEIDLTPTAYSIKRITNVFRGASLLFVWSRAKARTRKIVGRQMTMIR